MNLTSTPRFVVYFNKHRHTIEELVLQSVATDRIGLDE
jgi:hypothetical protein